MFFLCGDTDIVSMPSEAIMLDCALTQAVAVRAITFTVGGMRPLSSPSLLHSSMKPAPLHEYNQIFNVVKVCKTRNTHVHIN